MASPPSQQVPKADSLNRGTAVILLAQVIGLGLAYFAQILIAHSLVLAGVGKEGAYGYYQTILSLVMLFTHVIHYGLPGAISRWVATDPAYAGYFLSKGWKLQGYFALGLTLIALALGPFIVLGVIDDPRWWWPYLIAITGVPAYAYFNQRTSVMGGLRLFTAESKIYAVVAFTRFLWVILALWFFTPLGDWCVPAGWGSDALVTEPQIIRLLGIALFAPTISAMVGFWLARRATRFETGYREEPDFARKVIAYVLPNMLIAAMLQILMRYDLWSVVRFSGAGIAGLGPATPHPEWGDWYGAGNQLANLFFTLGASIYVTTFPAIAAFRAQGNDDGARAVLANSFRALAVVGFPFIALTAGGTREAMGLIFPAGYEQIGNALPILMAATVLQTLYMNLCVGLVAGGIQRPVVRSVGFMLIPGILYNVAFAWGLNRAGVEESNLLAGAVAAFCTALQGVLTLVGVASRELHGPIVDGRGLLKTALVGLLPYLVLGAIPHPGLWLLPVAALALVPYVVALLKVGVFTPEELERLYAKLRKVAARLKRPRA